MKTESIKGEEDVKLMLFKKNSNGGGSHSSYPSFTGTGGFAKAQVGLTILIICLIGFSSAFYKIGTEEQGVVTRFGAFIKIVDPGAHFKLPFGVDRVYKVPVTRIYESQFGFRKGSKNFSKATARQESMMLTGDLNVAVVQWILQWKVVDPKKFIFHAKNVEKNIRDSSVSVMLRVVGNKLVSDVLTTDRIDIAKRAKKLTQEVIDTYDMGVLITTINLQNVTPPDPVKPAFNEVNIARQEKEHMINTAKAKFNEVIPKARGRAQQRITESQAYAVDVINKAKGDSAKFTKVLKAYQMAPEITRKRLYLDTMREILTKTKSLVVVDSEIKGILPIYQKLMEESPKNGG